MATTKLRTLGPGVLKSTDATLTRDFSADVTKVVLTPSNSSDDPVTFLDGSQETTVTTSWTLEATVMDDYTMGGIGDWCLDHAGQTIPMLFTPASDDAGTAYKFNATVTPIGIGGDVKAKNTNDISWPITHLKRTAAKQVPVESVKISGNGVTNGKVTIEAGRSLQLTASVSPSTATDCDVMWSSSNIEIVAINNEWIRGVKAGTSTITAQAGGKSDTLTVTVTGTASASNAMVSASAEEIERPGIEQPGIEQ